MASQNVDSTLTRPLGALFRIGLPLSLVACGLAWSLSRTPTAPSLSAQGGITELHPPLPMPAFTLRDSDSRSFNRNHLRDHWTLLSLGFVSCPDICPTNLSFLSEAVSLSRANPEEIEVLFVSVDPERDTAPQLARYAKHFGDFVRGATGTHDQLRSLTEPLGLFYQRDPNRPDPARYGVEHSTTVLLISPSAEVVALLRTNELESADVARLLDQWRMKS